MASSHFQHQLEVFAKHAETCSDDVCEAFLRAILPSDSGVGCECLIGLSHVSHLHSLVWHGLTLVSLTDDQRRQTLPIVLESLLVQAEVSDVLPSKLVTAAARLVGSNAGFEFIAHQVLSILRPSGDEEAWVDSDKDVRRFACLLGLIQKLLIMNSCQESLSQQVLPVFLQVLQDQDAADVRKSKILGMIHHFYAVVGEEKVLPLWAAVEKSDPDLALALMCRMCAHLNKGNRFRQLLELPAFWAFVFRRMEENGLRKNIPLALSKQAMFLLREAVEACASLKISVRAEPFMTWNPKTSQARDWNAFLTLFELLEQYSIHLIEPVWPTFDQIAASGSVGSVWLQLLVRRGLGHDSVHVTRMILVFLFQSKRESLGWLSPEFFAGPLLSSLMLPVLYRGVSGMVYPTLVYAFWKRVFDDPTQQKALVVSLVPELFPSNPKFHHNVYAVPILLDIMTSSKQQCVDSIRQVGKILLLGRSHYCSDSAWRLVIECANFQAIGPTQASEFFARTHPHSIELVRDYQGLARTFFAQSGILADNRTLPTEEPLFMACCAYVGCDAAEARRVIGQSSNLPAALEGLVEMCGGSLQRTRSLLCGPNNEDLDEMLSQVEDSAVAFVLRLQQVDAAVWKRIQLELASDDYRVVLHGLAWLRRLSDPWYLRHCATASSDVSQKTASACVPLILSSFSLQIESSDDRRKLCLLQWSVLSQLVDWLHADSVCLTQIARHSGAFLSNVENHVEFEALRHVFECCASAPGAFGENVTHTELLRSLRLRFDEIVAEHESNRDAVSVLTSWAHTAFGDAARKLGLAPTCLQMLQAMELQHHRFQGVVHKAVERHFVPRWRQFLGEDRNKISDLELEQEAELLVLLLRQGQDRDEARKLDKGLNETRELEKKSQFFFQMEMMRVIVARFLFQERMPWRFWMFFLLIAPLQHASLFC